HLRRFFFFFSRYRCHRDLHSFPTRRSSDLGSARLRIATLVLPSLATHDDLYGRAPIDVAAGDRLLRLSPERFPQPAAFDHQLDADRKSTRLNSSHSQISYAVFCLKKKKKKS